MDLNKYCENNKIVHEKQMLLIDKYLNIYERHLSLSQMLLNKVQLNISNSFPNPFIEIVEYIIDFFVVKLIPCN